MASRAAAGAAREGEQLGEAEAAVAADARVRRLAARVAAHEGRDDGTAELLAQVERHVRKPEPMARLARGDHRLGRAAGALGVGPVRDRARAAASRRPRSAPAASSATALSTPPLIATATRPASRRGAEDRAERVRERVDRKRLAADRGRLEQRQAGERALEPGRVGLDDPVAVDEQPNGGPLAVAGRVSESSSIGSR